VLVDDGAFPRGHQGMAGHVPLCVVDDDLAVGGGHLHRRSHQDGGNGVPGRADPHARQTIDLAHDPAAERGPKGRQRPQDLPFGQQTVGGDGGDLTELLEEAGGKAYLLVMSGNGTDRPPQPANRPSLWRRIRARDIAEQIIGGLVVLAFAALVGLAARAVFGSGTQPITTPTVLTSTSPKPSSTSPTPTTSNPAPKVTQYLQDLASSGDPPQLGLVVLSGKKFPMSIYYTAIIGDSRDTTFDIAGRFRTFDATLGYERCNYQEAHYEVIANGVRIAEQDVPCGAARPVHIHVSVTGVQTLELYVRLGSDGTVAWGDAKLTG
jgi:NPCBM/NEW2 domain-containing protein